MFKPVSCLQVCSSGAFRYHLHSYCNAVVIITNTRCAAYEHTRAQRLAGQAYL